MTSARAGRRPLAAESLVEGLRRRGADLVFSHAMPPGVRRAAVAGGLAELPCRTGEAAVAMAYGHACARGQAGIALAGGELAVAELVAPLAASLWAGLPVLALVQPVAAGAVATRALLAGAVRAVVEIADAEAVEPALEAAFLALAGLTPAGNRPGPVALLLPPDLFFTGAVEPSFPVAVGPACSPHPAFPAFPHPLSALASSSHAGAPVPIALPLLLAEIARALGPRGILVSEDERGPVGGLGGGLGCRRAVCRSRALPVALGARLAAPSVPVVCLVGPGLRAGWADLQTARQRHLPLVMVVRNPVGAAGIDQTGIDQTGIDHAAIAAACGCIGIRVDRAEEVPAALHAALASDFPTVVDVLTET